MQSQGALGVLLLKQERLIEAQQQRLEQQEEELEKLKQALAGKAESQQVQEFRVSQQQIVQSLEANMVAMQTKADAGVERLRDPLCQASCRLTVLIPT
jgi:exonuclease VII large subunit